MFARVISFGRRVAKKLPLLRSTRLARHGGLLIEQWRGAVVKCAPRSLVTGQGRLIVGFRWPAYLVEKTLLFVGDRGTLTVNGDFAIHTGCKVVVDSGAKLEVGSGYLNSNSSINCFNSISIGRHVFIAENVTIRDSDNHSLSRDGHNMDGPIVIGDHVWIGMNVTILKGVTIGSGAVIAAGSVVVGDVASKSLVGGVPAKLLRADVEWH